MKLCGPIRLRRASRVCAFGESINLRISWQSYNTLDLQESWASAGQNVEYSHFSNSILVFTSSFPHHSRLNGAFLKEEALCAQRQSEYRQIVMRVPHSNRLLQTVLITGGSQGMGRSVAKLCAQKGANVIIVARNVEKLRAAVEYISVCFWQKPILLIAPNHVHRQRQQILKPSDSITSPQTSPRPMKTHVFSMKRQLGTKAIHPTSFGPMPAPPTLIFSSTHQLRLFGLRWISTTGQRLI